MLFCFFFNFLFIFILRRLLSKNSFFNTNFQNSFQDVVYYRILGCQNFSYQNGGPLNIRQHMKKKRPLFRSEISIFDIFFRRLHKEIFENLQINSN